MNLDTAPSCPACGFRIYNRRFPRCESCDAELPVSLVYSEAERAALLAEDSERDLERARQERSTDPVSGVPGTLDDAIVTSVVNLTRD